MRMASTSSSRTFSTPSPRSTSSRAKSEPTCNKTISNSIAMTQTHQKNQTLRTNLKRKTKLSASAASHPPRHRTIASHTTAAETKAKVNARVPALRIALRSARAIVQRTTKSRSCRGLRNHPLQRKSRISNAWSRRCSRTG